MSTPIISEMVVIMGALAVAGSNFIRVKIRGNSMPIILPTITVASMVRATTGMISGARQIATSETPVAIVIPRSNETANSLLNNRIQSCRRTSPMARARIISVADCDPAFPQLSISRGRKNTRATTV